MVNKWRPERWENPYIGADSMPRGNVISAYEEGADAMLEVLRKKKISEIPHWGQLYHVNHPSNGMYVFIPYDN